jgi:hypothetical protein
MATVTPCIKVSEEQTGLDRDTLAMEAVTPRHANQKTLDGPQLHPISVTARIVSAELLTWLARVWSRAHQQQPTLLPAA